MRPLLTALALASLALTQARAHLIPTVSVASYFTDGTVSFQLDLDLRLARDGQPVPPSTLLDGPGGDAERDALLALARAFIDEHLVFLFDDQPQPLDWTLEIYDPQEEGAPAAENQLHVLASSNLSLPPGTSSFRLRAGPELPASLILSNHRDGVAARRANVLFAGEASRPFAYAAPPPGDPSAAAPATGPTSTWRPPAVLHGLSLALQPLPALLCIALALSLRRLGLLLYPAAFGLGLQLLPLFPALRSVPLPGPDTLLLIALALATLAALLPPISLRRPSGTGGTGQAANPPPARAPVPAPLLLVIIAPALLIAAVAGSLLSPLPALPASHALATTLAASLALLFLGLAASFVLAPLHRLHGHTRRGLAIVVTIVGCALYLSP